MPVVAPPTLAASPLAVNAAARVPVTLQLTIPGRTPSGTSRRPSYLSPATQAIAIGIGVTGADTPPVSYNQNLTAATNPNCTASLVSPLICTVAFALAPGTYFGNFALYDAPLVAGLPTGNILAASYGSAIAVVAGQANAFTVALQGVPTSIVAIPAPNMLLFGSATAGFTLNRGAGPQGMTLAGVDADGNLILGPGAPTIALSSALPGTFAVATPPPSTPNLFTLSLASIPALGASIALTATVTPGAASGASPISTTIPVTFNGFGNNVTTLAVSGVTLSGPYFNALDASGNFYVANYSGGTIVKRTPAGVWSTFASGLSQPLGMGFDTLGNLYVAANTNVVKFTPAGVQSTFCTSCFTFGTGLAVAADNSIFVADYNGYKIVKITSAGVASTYAGSGASGSADGTGTAASFSLPLGLAIDPAGNLYVADTANNLVRKIDTAKHVTTAAGIRGSAGQLDGPVATAKLQQPWGIARDIAGNLFTTELSGCNVREISSGGIVSTFAGAAGTATCAHTDGLGTAARFTQPSGITINAANSAVYITQVGDSTALIMQ